MIQRTPSAARFIRFDGGSAPKPPGYVWQEKGEPLADLSRHGLLAVVFLDAGLRLGLIWEKRGVNDPETEAVS